MNVVVYVSDALRTDHVGCYGAKSVKTQTIDDLAASGLRYEQAVSAAPWTAPSMASIVTGLYPHHHGYLHWDASLAPGSTLFSAFALAGYEVGTFVFDESYLFRDLPEACVVGTSEGLDAVIGWLRAGRREPFLLFVHSWATHMPYDVLHAERREWRAAKRDLIEAIQSGDEGRVAGYRDAYRAAVERQSETLFASLLAELEALGVTGRTTIAFLSDHGESWGERYTDRADVQGIYHLHGATLYDEIVRVPLVLAAPGRLGAGVVTGQVRTVDLLPTLLSLAGLPAMPTDGEVLPLERDAARPVDRLAVLATTDRGALSQLGVRLPPWKLIHHLASGDEEGYRLDLDPGELTNRATEAPADLRASLNIELDGIDRQELSPEEEATVVARLADLGYM